MKLLFDENLSFRHARVMATKGHDAISIVDTDLCGASDETVRAFAISTERVLITLDSDFGNILRFPPTGTPGIIWLRLHPPSEAAIAKILNLALELLVNENLADKLVVVDEDKIRIRAG